MYIKFRFLCVEESVLASEKRQRICGVFIYLKNTCLARNMVATHLLVNYFIGLGLLEETNSSFSNIKFKGILRRCPITDDHSENFWIDLAPDRVSPDTYFSIIDCSMHGLQYCPDHTYVRACWLSMIRYHTDVMHVTPFPYTTFLDLTHSMSSVPISGWDEKSMFSIVLILSSFND